MHTHEYTAVQHMVATSGYVCCSSNSSRWISSVEEEPTH